LQHYVVFLPQRIQFSSKWNESI